MIPNGRRTPERFENGMSTFCTHKNKSIRLLRGKHESRGSSNIRGRGAITVGSQSRRSCAQSPADPPTNGKKQSRPCCRRLGCSLAVLHGERKWSENHIMMPTISTDGFYCSWCGTPGAPSICSCKKVSFCNRECLKSAWESHRLVCTFDSRNKKKTKNKSTWSYGDLVRIQGLQSQTTFNGRLAEIRSYSDDKKRYVVLCSLPEVKSILIKPENLTLELCARQAAIQSKVTGKEARKALAKSDVHAAFNSEVLASREYVDYACLPVQEMVNRLRNPEEQHFRHGVWCLCKEYFTQEFKLELLENGLADACLADFAFPETIDGALSRPLLDPKMPFIAIRILCEVLEEAKNPALSNPVGWDHHLKATSVKLCPLILLASTRKIRCFGATEYWWILQNSFLDMLSVCMPAFEKFQYSFHLPIVGTSLLEHLVFLTTVDPDAKILDISESLLRPKAIFLIKSIVQANQENWNQIQQLGLVPVPVGAKAFAGKSFAAVLLDVFAQTCVELHNFCSGREDYFKVIQQMLVDQKFLYSLFQSLPVLKREMGGRDATILGITGTMDEEVCRNFVGWSQHRMARSSRV